jgi:nicotinamide-nucleotide amidase
MKAAVLCTGTELTRGELVDTNGPWLAAALTQKGHDVVEVVSVADDLSWMSNTVRRLAKASELMVVCGGLGPTTDDITRSVVAEVLGVPLVRDQDQVDTIARRLAARGRDMTESNARQADLPQGADVFPNAQGTAPGFAVTLDGCRAYFMPGVPSEMRYMFHTLVAPAVGAASRGMAQVVLHAWGGAESAVCDRLAGIESAYDVTLGYRAHMPSLEIKVLATAAEQAEAEGRARSAANEVRRRLGAGVVFGEGGQRLATVVGSELTARGQSIALAESCTGGLVSRLLTEHAGASRYFLGAVVSYANSAKETLLSVPGCDLERWGAVSEPVARAMAEGTRKVHGSDVGLSFTGIAGPEGGSGEKPVGLVYIGMATAEATVVEKHLLFGSRPEVQMRAAFAGLNLVRKHLLGIGLEDGSEREHSP